MVLIYALMQFYKMVVIKNKKINHFHLLKELKPHKNTLLHVLAAWN